MMSRTIRSIAFDAKKSAREQKKTKFKASNSAEQEFFRALKKVAQQSGHIVDAFTDGADVKDMNKMTKALNNYAETLDPWARRQAAKMLEKVSRSNKRAYAKESRAMSQALKLGVADTEVGKVAIALLNEQVALIKSLPIEAGLRAQRIAAENFIAGRRAEPDRQVIEQLKEEMGMTTEVAINRARLIARTETARANSSFVQARAQAVGSTHYIWRCTMDGAERPSHRRMNGKTIAYDSPPTLSDGMTGHAGTFPNCRCWQDPVLPEE